MNTYMNIERITYSFRMTCMFLTFLCCVGLFVAESIYAQPAQIISFRTLRLYIPGQQPPKDIKDLNGKRIEVLGFMSALTQLEDIEEFVLASSPPMNCFCHPPLRVNEVILISMKKGLKTNYKGGVVKVRGRLEVNYSVQDEFADVMYTIIADEVL